MKNTLPNPSIVLFLCALPASFLVRGSSGPNRVEAKGALHATASKGELQAFFPGVEQARGAIVDDRAEPYFNRLQPLEMAAKTGAPLSAKSLEAQRAECRKRYQSAVLAFSAEDKSTLRWYLNGIAPMLQGKHPLVARTPWKFLKVSDAMESGLPHTRGAYIVFSRGFLQAMTQWKNGVRGEDGVALGTRTLIHEQCHVVQRAHKALFANLYRQWGFVRATSVASSAWVRKRQVLNPDGTDVNWMYPIRSQKNTRWIWPQIVFAQTDPKPRSLREMSEVAIVMDRRNGSFTPRLDAEKQPVMSALGQVAEYRNAWLPAEENFHPNEIEADLFSRLVVADYFASQKTDESANANFIARFRSWCKANLK